MAVLSWSGATVSSGSIPSAAARRNRFPWVQAATESGPRIDRVDVATGRRTPLLSVAPAMSAALFNFNRITLADDGKTYVYETRNRFSLLFTVEGVR